MKISISLLGNILTLNNINYLITRANNSSDECISLYNQDTNKYLRHFCSKIVESDYKLNTEKFEEDSSFIPEKSNDGIILRCSNKNLENLYICQDEKKEIVINNKLQKYIFIVEPNPLDYTRSCIDELKKNYSTLQEQFNDLNSKYRLEISSAKLRTISNNIRKKNRIAFIGTGKLGENTQYAFTKLYDTIKAKNHDIEIMYFARNKIEKSYFTNKNYPCELWSSLIQEQIQYLLLSKIAVFSTHTLAKDYSNSILISSLSGAFKIQLWHGFLAKMVGASTLAGKKDIVVISNMLEDTCVDIVTTAIISDDIRNKYEICFPGAKIVCTGDARTDILIENKPQCIPHINLIRKTKIIISPTYRESKKSSLAYISNLKELIIALNNQKIKLTVKFHPIYFRSFDINEKDNLLKEITSLGCDIIGEREDSYSILKNYDAMITDYSSIRFDYIITGKPVFLFRPDFEDYSNARKINPITEFDVIDKISYNLNLSNANQLYDTIKNDNNRQMRLNTLDELGLKRDGKSSERVAELILNLFNSPSSNS